MTSSTPLSTLYAALPNALRTLARYVRRLLWRWGLLVAWLRTRGDRKLILRDRRGLLYEIKYGEPFAELAGLPPSWRDFTDDPKMLAYMERILGPGNVVIDIGAAVGAITVLAGRMVRETGRVIAVEAEKGNYDQLCGNITRNGLLWAEAHHLAITDHDGTVTINVFPRSERGWHSIGRGEQGGPAPIAAATVACTTIDALVGRLGIARVDLLKIDIEGAEPEGFAGAAHSLSNGSIRRVIFEISAGPLQGMNHEIEDVIRPLRAAGYTFRSMQADGTLAVVDNTTIRNSKFANFVALAPNVHD